MSVIRKKLVVLGDGACGKTCLLAVFSEGVFPETHTPNRWDTLIVDVEADGKHVELSLCDTTSQDYFERLRPLVYPDSHVTLICFAIDQPGSLRNVQDTWGPRSDTFSS